MADVDRNVGSAAHLHGFGHGAEERRALAADMARVQAAALSDRRRHGDQLVGVGEQARLVDQTAREADGAVLERVTYVVAHRAHLAGVGLVPRAPEDVGADGAVPDETGDVRAGPAGVDRVQIVAEAAPRPADTGSQLGEERTEGAGSPGGHRESPQLPTTTLVTPWRRTDPMAGSTKGRWSACVCTSMKPGARHAPVQSTTRRAVAPSGAGPTSAMRSPIDADVGDEAVGAGPVDDRGAGEEHIEHDQLLPARRGRCAAHRAARIRRAAARHAAPTRATSASVCAVLRAQLPYSV